MKILAISLAYPPLAYPRSVQVARLLRHADVATVLLCAEEPGARLDTTIEPGAESRLQECIRVPVPAEGADRHLDRLAHRFAPAYWRRRNFVPDRYGKWKSKVISEASRFIGETDFRPDAIVTFAQPFTDHLIGLELKARFKLPWLAHFSDPWVDNPFMPLDQRTKELNLKLERSVVENADLVVFTSSETVDLFFEKYRREVRSRARVLPHCFDPELYEGGNRKRSEKLKVRYLGNFYGQRTPRPLVAALVELQRRRPGSLDDISFELIGSGDYEEFKRMSGSLPAGVLNVRPSVPYRESVRLMSDSDGLLIIDAPADVSVFLPSKLIDYLGAGRPILGITPKGTAASLIGALGGIVADPSNVGETAEAIEKFTEMLKGQRARTDASERHDSLRDKFSVARVASEFRSMLETLVDARPDGSRPPTF